MKTPVSSQQLSPFQQYKHSSPLEHSTQKSKHTNDKLFSYLQEAYLWVKARDFCIHQLQRLQVRGGRFYGWYALKKLHELATLSEVDRAD
jgi:hypothetical protein